MAKQRYFVQRLGPSATNPDKLIERCGDSWESFEEYASIDNVIRFGLRKAKYPPGQYRIYLWLPGETRGYFKTAYKRA